MPVSTDEHVSTHTAACLNVMAPVGSGLSSPVRGSLACRWVLPRGWRGSACPWEHFLGACEIRHPAKMVKHLQMFTPRCLSHASAGEATFAGLLGGKSTATQEYRSPQRGAQVAVLLLETSWLPARAPGLSVLIDTLMKWSNSTAKSSPVLCTNTSAAFELVPRARGIKQLSSNPWLSVPRSWADLPPWAKEQGTGCRKQGRERCVPPPRMS